MRFGVMLDDRQQDPQGLWRLREACAPACCKTEARMSGWFVPPTVVAVILAMLVAGLTLYHAYA